MFLVFFFFFFFFFFSFFRFFVRLFIPDFLPDTPMALSTHQAFQAKKTKMRLSKGFFADKPTYDVFFAQKPSGQSYQINHSTGMRRTVRRLGNDDSSLFVAVGLEEVFSSGDEKCSICQGMCLMWQNAGSGTWRGGWLGSCGHVESCRKWLAICRTVGCFPLRFVY